MDRSIDKTGEQSTRTLVQEEIEQNVLDVKKKEHVIYLKIYIY